MATIATPIISPIAGSYREKVEVALRCVTPNVAIYYTIDGSTPDATDSLYSDGTIISVSSTTTIKAIGILSGFTNSAVASSVFTIVGLTYQYNMNLKHTGAGEGFINDLYAETFVGGVSGDDGYTISSSSLVSSSNMLYVGNINAQPYNLFVRFTNVVIPQGNTINSAVVRLVGYEAQAGANCHLRYYFADEDNPAAPTSWAEYAALGKTSALQHDSFPAVTDGEIVFTSDLASILQTVIDRVGWVSGNALIFILANRAAAFDSRRVFSSADYLSGTEKAQLLVNHS